MKYEKKNLDLPLPDMGGGKFCPPPPIYKKITF